MSSERKTVKAIFQDALDRPSAAERAVFLDEVCAGDAALRQSVNALLEAHDRPDALLDQPAALHIVPKSADDRLDFLEPTSRTGAIGRLGHYDILDVVGRGGMGVVLRAFDDKLHRVVAVKALNPVLAGNIIDRQRFGREARATAAVNHDNVISIHGVEESGPVPYLVMQFIDGRTLQQKLDRTGQLPLKEVLRIGMQIAEGLAAAHRQGLIHRDITPANILLENGVERVKITDFGLARAVDGATVTQRGYIAGTPAYMSPEQANGERVDHRTDLFSFGSVLYTICAGHPPFRADTTIATLKRVCEEIPRPLREVNPGVPDWLERLIAKLQAKKPEDRFTSAAEVAGLLSGHLAELQSGESTNFYRDVAARLPGEPAQARKRRAIGNAFGASVVVVAIVISGWLIYQSWQGKRRSTDQVPPDSPNADATQPAVPAWTPRPPLTLAELAKLPDPLDNWRRDRLPAGTKALLSRTSKDFRPELTDLLGNGPFRPPNPQITHWPTQSRDGRLIALPCGNDVDLFDAKTGAFLRKLTGHKNRACRGGFSSDGKRFACSSVDGRIRIWNVDSAQEESSTQGGRDGWTTIFAPGDQKIIVAGGRGVIEVWDGTAGKSPTAFGEHVDSIGHFALSPDGARLASGGRNGVIKIWSWPDGALQKSIEGHDDEVLAFSFSRDGSLLASGSTTRVNIWDNKTLQPVHVLRTAGDGLLAFTADGESLLAAPHHFPPGQKRAFTRWNVKSSAAAGAFDVPGPRSYLIGLLSNDDRTAFLMSCDPVEARLGAYDAVTGKERFPHAQTGIVLGVAFSPDGRWLASAGHDGGVCIWDLEARQSEEFIAPVQRLTGHKGRAGSVAFSPDSRLVATGGADGTIRLWTVADGKEVQVLSGYSLPLAAIAFSPDGETLATGSKDGAINLWNVKSGRLKDPLRWHVGPVRAVAFSPDGRWLASAGIDRAVQLVELANADRLRTFRAANPVTGLAFSPDSQALAATTVVQGPGPSAYVWDIETRNEVTFAGHTEHVLGVAFHPAGNRIATSASDGTVRFWNTASDADTHRVIDFQPLGSAFSAAFSPSGRHLAVGLGSGAVAILRMP